MSTFYNRVTEINSELSRVFEELAPSSTISDWQEIQEKFHDQIEAEFPTVSIRIDENIAEESNPIPERLSKRIKVATLLLTYLVIGVSYSRELYLKTLDFCTSAEIKNGNFAKNIS